MGIKSRVEGVEILGVKVILGDAEGFTEPLEVDNLPLAEEADRIADLRVLDEAEDVVVGGAGFLLRCGLVRTT